ncbi:hypothetical protein [Spirosoma pollinicola]|nr:hypothetical protein [Spirosoma pollinicola]
MQAKTLDKFDSLFRQLKYPVVIIKIIVGPPDTDVFNAGLL